jgi:hypothetical protein
VRKRAKGMIMYVLQSEVVSHYVIYVGQYWKEREERPDMLFLARGSMDSAEKTQPHGTYTDCVLQPT